MWQSSVRRGGAVVAPGGRVHETTEALPAEAAERRRFEAQFRYLCALHAQAFSTPAPWEVLQEMEMDARFEHVANHERHR